MKKGSRVDDYILNELIGKGSFGEVWCATNVMDHSVAAIKVVNNSSRRKMLQAESSVLQNLKDSTLFPKFVKHWEYKDCGYLVMEKLNETLKRSIDRFFSGRVSLHNCADIGIKMLKAIQVFHEHGYIHRDLKPSNFMYRDKESTDLCLIDFGLSRKWQSDDGLQIPPRYSIGFRGTSKYASLNSHDGLELSRRDDLWSFFYILCEMIAPPLPWWQIKNKNQVADKKRKAGNRLVIGLPTQFQDIMDYINSLQYESEPDYFFMHNKLKELLDIGEKEETQNYDPLGFNFGQIDFIVQSGDDLDDTTSSVAGSISEQGPVLIRSFSHVEHEFVSDPEPEGCCCCCNII